MAVGDLIPIPGDTAVNLPLAVGWCAAVHRPKSVLVYHCTSGNLNPCNRGKMGFQVLATFEIPIPFVRALTRPYADFTTSNFRTQYWNAISQQAPAIICDFYLWLTGRKPSFSQNLRSCYGKHTRSHVLKREHAHHRPRTFNLSIPRISKPGVSSLTCGKFVHLIMNQSAFHCVKIKSR
ncbi:putative inactive fatty acyl-CoA reductase 2-like protein isoform X1 [Pan paniscus]|uniref:putative inactive fatty acyl-CoA reductase 2-like protein isoform X1 n=2 Tax=Pan troglodytes TaxID=9598 RepID=UPI0007DB8EF3|nr:putative inactive fatty acyl-CoA reductase 2-like protein isoform X1 [Pan troglodytes]XP_054535711.1 putative inactive fatty acyl-CoA reductase 2-like protein isoform X1 [Pan troglodytes]XP_054535712.1 putative inactive fatty acyl-CoA reductase 2-like protein isoform X1 [Pan troglodytes]XP_054965389.1 putative inactive fatty acyl-CoA reductase 2-like protein isoform X1 [Pan paniscus]XP_054965390.1 putative inactive fatty acyl-CoA reductase 2-like protein isoform X1 [Pan paniscus]XP_05496539